MSSPQMWLYGCLLDRLQRRVGTEIVPTYQAPGRVTAEAVLAPEHLPAFPRSTMDGYAVRARDTFGASESLPAYLEVVGEVRMGQAPDITLATGQAAVAYTGGMLAHSADAVVMVENTQTDRRHFDRGLAPCGAWRECHPGG